MSDPGVDVTTFRYHARLGRTARHPFTRLQLVTLVSSLAAMASAAGAHPLRAQGVAAEPAPPSRDELEGARIVLVTGSTSGLGREGALALAEPGTHVIVHGRNRERGLEVVAEIEQAGATASFYAADFASMAEVRALGEAILRDYDHLNVLVNNAGIWLTGDDTRYESADGYELSFAVNYLSGYLLTRMLLPLIPDDATSRIVNVASVAQTPIDFDDPMIEENYSGNRSYGQSKLAQVTFTMDLARELADTDIVVTTLHPATLMDTNMVLSAGVEPRSSVEEGRDAVMHLIESPDIPSGSYFNGENAARANDQAYDEDAQRRLRELSDGLVSP